MVVMVAGTVVAVTAVGTAAAATRAAVDTAADITEPRLLKNGRTGGDGHPFVIYVSRSAEFAVL
jgi:tetrahydromethanopterin S-methyltransferase subunit D